MKRSSVVALGTSLLLTVAFGACDRGESPATTTTKPRSLPLAKEPYLGIACGQSNSISSARACDRVGLAVWLKRPAQRVTASIAGHQLALSNTGELGEHLGYWEAFLHPAGLDHGALELPRQGADYWAGEPPVSTPVWITAHYNDGSTMSARKRVRLHPGYG